MTDSQLALLARSRRKKVHAHWWIQVPAGYMWDQETETWWPKEPTKVCDLCRLPKADYEARQKMGRNNRARGGRAELAVARTYGGEKVGPLGLPEDIRGKQWATQVKVSKREAPPMWRAEFGKLSGQRDRTPRLILRFARQGVKAEDFVVVRGEDWLAWFGKDE